MIFKTVFDSLFVLSLLSTQGVFASWWGWGASEPTKPQAAPTEQSQKQTAPATKPVPVTPAPEKKVVVPTAPEPKPPVQQDQNNLEGYEYDSTNYTYDL